MCLPARSGSGGGGGNGSSQRTSRYLSRSEKCGTKINLYVIPEETREEDRSFMESKNSLYALLAKRDSTFNSTQTSVASHCNDCIQTWPVLSDDRKIIRSFSGFQPTSITRDTSFPAPCRFQKPNFDRMAANAPPLQLLSIPKRC